MTSTQYYKSHPEARRRKAAYDRKLNSRPTQIKKRVEANRANRRAGTYGNGDKKDYDHKTRRFISQKRNRGRRGEGNR